MVEQNCIEQIKNTAIVFDVINSMLPLKQVSREWVANCPFHEEKTPSFKVSKTKNIYKCFGCGESGDSIEFLIKYKKLNYIQAIEWLGAYYHIDIVQEQNEPVKVFAKPILKEGQISSKWLQWFSARGITPKTLQDFKITMVEEWMPKANGNAETICFNYFRAGELINIKYRADNKDFKLSKDAELIFYNLDAIAGHETVVIVEGEIDCLSVYQAKINAAVVSVPNGAAKGNMKLDYLNTCFDAFRNVKNIVLMVDNDEPGLLLREELARRFGYDKCLKVEYPSDCKDANDILVKHGAEKIIDVIADAVEFPIEGVFAMADMIEDVRGFYAKGYPVGIKVGISGFDDHLQLMLSQITIITGIPGSGKSEFTDHIMTEAAKNHGWQFAICSFENQPSSLHVTKIMEKYVGKSFLKRVNDADHISPDEFEGAINFIDSHFYFININKVSVTLQGILDKAKELVLRKGIKGLLIDPWNYIEHKVGKGQTETQYISDCLTLLKAFAAIHSVHIFFIAHPSKMAKMNGKYEVPTLYHISGSAHFFNKTDNGITVHRNYDNNTVDVHIQKVRFSWLGKVGVCSFLYNTETRQYEPLIKPKGVEKEPDPPQDPYKGFQRPRDPSASEINWNQ